MNETWQWLLGLIVPPSLAGTVYGIKKVSEHETRLAVLESRHQDIKNKLDKIDERQEDLIDHLLKREQNGNGLR